MAGKMFIRQTHRWTSFVFTIISAAIFASLGAGYEPPLWIYYLPLFPLALMIPTGIYMFFQPYSARSRAALMGGEAQRL